jgi:hypothetical protein
MEKQGLAGRFEVGCAADDLENGRVVIPEGARAPSCFVQHAILTSQG